MTVIEGDFSAGGARFAILAARFNALVVEQLEAGALDALRRHGVAERNITRIKAPGAWELPVVAQRLAASGRYDAIIAVGAVIRGATPHFDYVAGACAKGLAQVALRSGLPVAFGVLTVDSIEQAMERSGAKAGNKGAEAALAALETVNVMQRIGGAADA